MKERLDVLLVRQGLAESREKAKAVIMAGCVYVNDQKEDKAGAMFDESKVHLEVRGNTLKYVSRGGLKLEKAIDRFGVSLDGKICMDIGASTGGFTDCMLQNGAKKVYSVDVGHGQLAWKLRNDERVICMEKRIFVIWFRRISGSGLTLRRLMCPLSRLTRYWGLPTACSSLRRRWYASSNRSSRQEKRRSGKRVL